MKPDILRDPVLKYVKEVTAPEGFSEVFSRDTRSKQLMLPKGSLPLFTGVEKINSIVSSARITSQRQLFSGDERRRSISPRKMPNETSKNSLTSR